ncbi:hypothetical protein HPB47_017181 [Ixodes persulcatus]|uniref:Uncharacterized protein n=1 Tax=Ixodes persulcatus TaxID=34615 RepID=A0AC60QSN6_IXOPE|nr:hypothetical protein HPB47_017181 [Ixodes persulcatus]
MDTDHSRTSENDLGEKCSEDAEMIQHPGEIVSPYEDVWLAITRNQNGKLRVVPEGGEVKTPARKQPIKTQPINGRTYERKQKQARMKLPRGGYKVVIRPRDGLDLNRAYGYQLVNSIAAIIGVPEQTLERKIRIQRNLDQNLITIQTDEEGLARKIAEMKQIIHGGRQYNVVAYPAMPEGTIRGVIHEVEENTDPARLKDSIYVEDGTEIISARMLGKSNSAIITFNGNRLPRYVIYRATRTRCYLYRPHMHACTVCLKPGHRADVCPTPGAKGKPTRSHGYQRRLTVAVQERKEEKHKQGRKRSTDHNFPTRVGNSVQRDTTPDLALTLGVEGRWTNTQMCLGSDHNIVDVRLEIALRRRYLGKQKITDWELFRENRRLNGNVRDMSLQEWTSQLQWDERRHTKEIRITEEIPEIDSRLLNLWEARRSLVKRWIRQKLNKTLKKKIGEVTAKALEHANSISWSNWNQKCEALQGTLGTAKAWRLLRNLLDPTSNKLQTRHSINKIIHDFKGSNEELIGRLKTRYIGSQANAEYLGYSGEANEELDKDFTMEEVKRAAQDLKRNSTPGKDGVQNRLLRNLDEESYETLTRYLNEIWSSGRIPPDWKHAEITLIPKPGKKLDLDNLRPISITSCLGKLMEHVVLNRLQPYLEETNFYSNTMFGFRKHLSAQDVFLQLKEDVLQPAKRGRDQTILALDIKGAFDHVGHDLILRNLARAKCGIQNLQLRERLSARKNRHNQFGWS